MLRIKNDVDLKILKRYGFKEVQQLFYHTLEVMIKTNKSKGEQKKC